MSRDIDNIADVVNKQSKAIKALLKKIERMEHKVELQKQQIIGIKMKLEEKSKSGNIFGGLGL